MGYQLRRWLRTELGPDISGLPRAVALEIADDANDSTRLSYVPLEQLREWTAAKSERVVRDAIQRLAAAGWEFRIELGKDKNGSPLYAVPGKSLRFRVPTCRAGETQVTEGAVRTYPSARGSQNVGKGQSERRQGAVRTCAAYVLTAPISSPLTIPSEISPPVTNTSLSPSPKGASAQSERDQLMSRIMGMHGVSREVAEQAWEWVHDEGRGMQSLRAWVNTCPEDVAEKIEDILLEHPELDERQQRAADAKARPVATDPESPYHRGHEPGVAPWDLPRGQQPITTKCERCSVQMHGYGALCAECRDDQIRELRGEGAPADSVADTIR